MPTVKSYEDYMRDVLKVTEPEKQSVYQKQKNRIDYQKYASNYLAEQNKNQQIAELERNKQKSLSESAIANERARQYIDAVNKHYGIAGTGYGESKAIDLYSEAAKQRAEINDSYDKGKNEALTAYQNALAQNELTASDKLGEIELYKDEANESKRQSYVAMLQELNDNPDVSKEEFTKYYDAYKRYLGEDDKLLKADLESKAAAYNTQDEQEKIRVAVATDKGVKLGDAVTLDALVSDNKALGDYKDKGEQTALINAIINLARTEGTDSLEGKAIDVNYGNGKAYYYYSNGSFYKISKSDAKKIGIVEIDAQGNIKKTPTEAERAIEKANSESFKATFSVLNKEQKQYYLTWLENNLTEEQMQSIPEYIKNSDNW